jgi:hypothetical protein
VPGDPYRSCSGLCDVHWLTRWDSITGERHSSRTDVLSVSMGETIAETDKRRAGAWYIGVKALPTESGEFSIAVGLDRPKVAAAKPYCSGHERFCAPALQREAHLNGDGPITTSADVRHVPLSYAAAASSAAPQRRQLELQAALAAFAAAGAACLLAAHPARARRMPS